MFITCKVCVLGVGGNRVGTSALKGLAHLVFFTVSIDKHLHSKKLSKLTRVPHQSLLFFNDHV